MARRGMVHAFITLGYDAATLAITKGARDRARGDDATHGMLRALRAIGENKTNRTYRSGEGYYPGKGEFASPLPPQLSVFYPQSSICPANGMSVAPAQKAGSDAIDALALKRFAAKARIPGNLNIESQVIKQQHVAI